MNKAALLFAVSSAFSALACAQDSRHILTEAQNRGRSQSQRFEGTLEVIRQNQKPGIKRWVFERTGSYGNSKTLLRFTEPAEVKGVALLVINHPDRAADEWMWIPSEGRDRRIAAQARSTAFFGTDFSFEDLEERDVDQFEYNAPRTEALSGVECWVIDAKPKQSKASQYTSSTFWIRKDNYALLRIDNLIKGKLVRRINYGDIEKTANVTAPRLLEVLDPVHGSRTVLRLSKVQFNIPINDAEFTREALSRGSEK